MKHKYFLEDSSSADSIEMYYNIISVLYYLPNKIENNGIKNIIFSHTMLRHLQEVSTSININSRNGLPILCVANN